MLVCLEELVSAPPGLCLYKRRASPRRGPNVQTETANACTDEDGTSKHKRPNAAETSTDRKAAAREYSTSKHERLKQQGADKAPTARHRPAAARRGPVSVRLARPQLKWGATKINRGEESVHLLSYSPSDGDVVLCVPCTPVHAPGLLLLDGRLSQREAYSIDARPPYNGMAGFNARRSNTGPRRRVSFIVRERSFCNIHARLRQLVGAGAMDCLVETLTDMKNREFLYMSPWY